MVFILDYCACAATAERHSRYHDKYYRRPARSFIGRGIPSGSAAAIWAEENVSAKRRVPHATVPDIAASRSKLNQS